MHRTLSGLGVAILVALCAWMFLRVGEPTGEASRGGARVDPIPRSESLPPAAIEAATKTSDRTAILEISSPDPPATEAKVPRPQSLVFGSLLDSFGAPIRGDRSVGVRFIDHSGRRRSSEVTQEGAYELHALEMGTHWVTASAQGYRSLEETLDLTPLRPEMRKDFTLHRAVELRVRVETPDGRNLFDVLGEERAPKGARILVPIATREPPGERFDEVVGSVSNSFGVGRFQRHDPGVNGHSPESMGILLLDCDLPVWVSLVHYQVVLQSERVDSDRDEVTFVVSPDDLLAGLATIRVRVLDADTELPIHRARAMLRGGTYFDVGVATDPQGIAAIGGREPGRFDFQVSARGYESFRKPVDARPGEISDLGTVALEREVTVEGHVLGLEYRAVAASFSLGTLDPTDRSIEWSRHEGFKSRGDGSFEIRGLRRGEYVIRTIEPGALYESEWKGIPWVSGNVLVDTRAGSIDGLDIRLRPAARLVVQMSGEVADGMGFRVVDERGLESASGNFHGSEPRALDLPAGNYDVSLIGERGAVLSRRSVTLGPETVELQLAR